MSSELISFVPKPLRDALGEEGTDALVVLLNQSQTVGRRSMEQYTSERFERRLVEETSKLRSEFKEETSKLWIAIAELRAEMHAGFVGIQEQFKDVYREIAKVHSAIADVHKSIASQTRWIIAVIFATVLPIYLALAKLIFNES